MLHHELPLNNYECKSKRRMKIVRMVYVVLAVLILFFSFGCAQKAPAEKEIAEKKIAEEEKIEEAKKIQKSFEEAYASLKSALEAGDAKAVQESLEALKEAYNRAKEKAGEAHLQFIVGEENLQALEQEIKRGDFESAKQTLKGIGGSCGLSVCHQRSGGAMANLEYEYGVIKKALNKGDLATAKQHLPEFKRYFYESKNLTAQFLPELTKERMKDEYVQNLEAALNANDTEKAREAMQVISENTCSLKGCHTIFFH